jgi:hypothetical protein
MVNTIRREGGLTEKPLRRLGSVKKWVKTEFGHLFSERES